MTQPAIEMNVGAPKYRVLNAFMRDRARVDGIMGPLGSGKTFGCIQRILLQMQEQEPNAEKIRPTRWVVVRNVHAELAGTTIPDFLAVFDGFGDMKYGGRDPAQFNVHFIMGDGTHVKSNVMFLALDRPEHERKLRGIQATGFWFNEAKEIEKNIIDMADFRHGRYPSVIAGGVECGWHGMLFDTNAMDEDHWYYRLAEEDRPIGWTFFRQPGAVTNIGKNAQTGRTLWDPNPLAENLANLKPDYYTAGIEAKTDDWIKVNIANEYGFSVDGKPVHPEFIDSVHTSPNIIEPNRAYPLICGYDFGRTPAAIIFQYLAGTDRWVAIDEFCTHDMSAAIFGPEFRRYLDQNYPGMEDRGWGDPAGSAGEQATENTAIEMLRASGLSVQPCSTNNPNLRRAAISTAILRNSRIDGLPCFLISPKCKILRKGLAGGFCFKRMRVSGTERFGDVPDKNMYSHPVEAAEYALLGEGEGRQTVRQDPLRRPDRGQYQIVADM